MALYCSLTRVRIDAELFGDRDGSTRITAHRRFAASINCRRFAAEQCDDVDARLEGYLLAEFIDDPIHDLHG